jgi:SAM-dependent methyltransferase
MYVSNKIDALVKKYYGSSEWVGGTSEFKQMIEDRLVPGAMVLDAGAGSGKGYTHGTYGGNIHLVGIDISPEVFENPYLDEAYCCDAGRMPFRNEEFDLVFSDYVLEHLCEPSATMLEVYRVLKPGGYFIIRTPNRWHYVPTIATVFPGSLATGFLSTFTSRSPEDVFPTFYRCNTERSIRRIVTQVGFTVERLVLIEKEPSYLTFSALLFRLGVLYERTVNWTTYLRHFRANIIAAFRKERDGVTT